MRKLLILFILSLPGVVSANIIGSDLQNFNPGASILDYVTVHSSKTLKPGQFSLGLTVNRATNTLPYFDSEGSENIETSRRYLNSITSADANIAVGVLENLHLTLAVPYLLDQEVRRSTDFYGSFEELGNTELRGGFKWAFLPLDYFGMALVGTVNYNRVKDNPYSGNEEWPAFSAELVGELDFGIISTAVNVGHRWRKSGISEAFDEENQPIEPFADQWIFSVGADLHIPATVWHILAESYGSYTEDDISSLSPRNSSVLEGVGAVRYQPWEHFFAQVGFGREMKHAVSSADDRYFLGVYWSFGPFKRAKQVAPAPVIEQTPVAPAPKVAIIDLEDILFEFNSDVVRSDVEESKLIALREALSNKGTVQKIVIEGHACAIGTETYNLDLSERRADSLVEWVVQKFEFPREKVIPVGFGEQVPHESNISDENRRRNRRVRFAITYN